MTDQQFPASLRLQTYIQFRDVFSGLNAQIRQPKAIQRVLNKKGVSSQFHDFCNRMNIKQNHGRDCIQFLLAHLVFENDNVARNWFPLLFQLPVTQKTNITSSNAEIVKEKDSPTTSKAQDDTMIRPVTISTAAELPKPKELEVITSSIPAPITTTSESSDFPEKTKDKGTMTENEVADVFKIVQQKIPDLFPVYLPYPVQHTFTTEAQKLLEEACFEFARLWLPKEACLEDFRHPENAELGRWIDLIQARRISSSVPSKAFDITVFQNTSLNETIKSVTNLRHTAVHRLKTHSKDLENLLGSSLVFLRFLKDSERAAKMAKMLAKALELSTALENEKISLRDMLEAELRDIELTRRELIRREEQALSQVLIDNQMARERITIDLESLFEEPEQPCIVNQPLDTKEQPDSDSEVEVSDTQSPTTTASTSDLPTNKTDVKPKYEPIPEPITKMMKLLGIDGKTEATTKESNASVGKNVRTADFDLESLNSVENCCSTNIGSTIWLGNSDDLCACHDGYGKLAAEIDNMDEDKYESATEDLAVKGSPTPKIRRGWHRSHANV